MLARKLSRIDINRTSHPNELRTADALGALCYLNPDEGAALFTTVWGRNHSEFRRRGRNGG